MSLSTSFRPNGLPAVAPSLTGVAGLSRGRIPQAALDVLWPIISQVRELGSSALSDWGPTVMLGVSFAACYVYHLGICIGILILDITFDTQRLQKLCSSKDGLTRRYGDAVAKKVMLRLTQLDAVDRLEDMRQLPGRCHELKGDRHGELAVDLHQSYRLIFEPTGEPPSKEDGGLDWSSVTSITVLGIDDYH